MKKVQRVSIGVCLSLLTAYGTTGWPGEGLDCARIEDAAERLACFDRQFPRETTREKAADAPAPTQPAPSSPAATTVAPPATVIAPATADRTPSAAEPRDAPTQKDTTFLGDERIDMSSTIRAIRREDKQNMVFMLDNEQIWMQSKPRTLPFKQGDAVTIKNAFLGGYYMENEEGVSTRVKRIK